VTATDTDAQWIADTFGPVAAQEFNGAKDTYKADLVTWARDLPDLSDDAFARECAHAIFDSAQASRFRGNWEHEHFKATACFREARRRHVAAGHSDDCRGDTAYGFAHARVMKANGYTPSPPASCTCGEA